MPASSPGLASSSSTLKPRFSAQRISMRSTISAQSWASVPPAPALTVTSASPASYLPANSRSSSSAARRSSTEANASSTSPASSSSSSASSTSPSRSSASERRRVKASSLRWVRVCSAPVRAATSGSSQKPGAPISASSVLRRSCRPAGSKIVREQGHLLADGGQALGRGLGGGGRGHRAPEASGVSLGGGVGGQPLAHHRLGRGGAADVGADGREEGLAPDRQRGDGADGGDRGGARHVAQEPDLAEEAALAEPPRRHAGARDDDLALRDHVERLARLALA